MSEPEVVQGLEPPPPPLTVVQAIAPPPLDVSTCPDVPVDALAPTLKLPVKLISPVTSNGYIGKTFAIPNLFSIVASPPTLKRSEGGPLL